MLTEMEIRKRLILFRFDPVYRGHDQRVPIACLADMIHLSRQRLYHLMNDESLGMSSSTREKLCYVFALIDKGLRFRRRDRRWEPVMPDGSAPPMFDLAKGEVQHGLAHVFMP